MHKTDALVNTVTAVAAHLLDDRNASKAERRGLRVRLSKLRLPDQAGEPEHQHAKRAARNPTTRR